MGRDLLPQLDPTRIQSNPRFWIPKIPEVPSQLPTGIQPLDAPRSHSQRTPFSHPLEFSFAFPSIPGSTSAGSGVRQRQENPRNAGKGKINQQTPAGNASS